MTDNNQLNIFISYGRQDSRELANRLRDDLRAVGHSVWLDVAEIPGGANWSQQVEEAIEHCDLALALLSHSSYTSQWCRAEQLRAIRKGKRVIPVLVQADAERPLHLEHLNYLSFTDVARYDDVFRDLVSDITAGQAFRLPEARRQPDTVSRSPFKTRRRSRSAPGDRGRAHKAEKRDARAFRRHLRHLREEAWLGSRYWWPYFLFHFTDIHSVVETLKGDSLQSPVMTGGDFNNRWDKYVRLDFRPRTPDLWFSEGFRPPEKQGTGRYIPLPIYLLFDLEAVICQPESRFSEGDPARTGKTYKTSSAFGDLPFDTIYHDSWFLPDEREEIMRCRASQVVVPDQMGLESLQVIWCRSTAEYETLRQLLPDELWRKWRDKITARTDHNLFNRKWVYVERAALDKVQMRVQFNQPEKTADGGPFAASLVIEDKQSGQQFEWQDESFRVENDLIVDLSDLKLPGEYSVRLLLDGELAYAGEYADEDGVY